jgi:signal transduction histidine kinase
MSIFRSLHGKLIVTTGLVISLTLGVYTYFDLKSQKQRLEKSLFEKLEVLSETLVKSYTHEMKEGNLDGVKHAISNQAVYPDILDIKLLNPKGQINHSVTGSTGFTELPMSSIEMDMQQDSFFIYRSENELSFIHPINNSQSCYQCHPADTKTLGYVQIDYDLDFFESNFSDLSLLAFGVVLFLVILISTLLWFFQNRFLRKPILNLMSAMDLARKGDLSARAKESGSDEIFRLSRNFNHMILRLGKAQNDIKVLHDRQMERAERLATAGELASGIAHEIKNPLAGISSTIQVLLENGNSAEAQEEILTEMYVQVGRIEKAVKDLLSYACPSPPEFKSGDINECIHRNIFFITPIAEKQNTVISSELGDNIPDLLFDHNLIDQVLVNILINALQALKANGNISVNSTYNSDDEIIEIIISDDGPGIPADMTKRIFSPFFTTKHKGSGLGLSICRKNIERHHGSLKVFSQVKEGSGFIIRLPVNMTFELLYGGS